MEFDGISIGIFLLSYHRVSLLRLNVVLVLHSSKKVAIVMMGEPNASFRARVGELILTEKQEKMDAEHKDKLKIKERKKKVEEARKEADKRRKQAMARNQ